MFLFALTLALPWAARADDSDALPEAVSAPIRVARSSAEADETPMGGCGTPALNEWFRGWRQRQRQGYALKMAHQIPSYGKISCINTPRAFDAAFKRGNYFVTKCLAQSNGLLTHTIEQEILVDPAECMSDAKIATFVASPQCKMPNGPEIFLNTALKKCGIAFTRSRDPVNHPEPVLRDPDASIRLGSVDSEYLATVLRKRPDLAACISEEGVVADGCPPLEEKPKKTSTPRPRRGNPLGENAPGFESPQ
jgi:hypothetical protein